MPDNNTFVIEENEKIINIVDSILYFNQLEQQGSGSKILTPNQMLSRLPITLAQLNAGNNSENLKNPNKNMALANLSIYYIWKNIKSKYSNNKFNITAPTWNHTFDLPSGLILLQIFKIILSLLLKNMKF